MTNGQTYQLKPELPKNTAADITYSSNHASIASVSKYGGKVTAHNPGKAIITIKTHNGKTAKFTVNVTAKCRTLIKQSYVKNNSCYIVNKKITVKGLMLHSVGANIQSAQKWVDTYNSKAYYPLYKGGTIECCVHGFIDGYNGTLYQTLPWNTKGWHSGGSANKSYIGIEMCEPACIKYTKGANFTCSAKNKAKAQAVVKKTYESAVNLFAYLCAKYKLNPLGKNVIISHNEGYKLGIASGHKDPEHLWKQLGMPYTMDTFRKDVKKAMENQGWIIYD